MLNSGACSDRLVVGAAKLLAPPGVRGMDGWEVKCGARSAPSEAEIEGERSGWWVFKNWWWWEGARPVGVCGPRLLLAVDSVRTGGVEAAEGDNGGRLSNGFVRSRPFASALGVRSAGVEGQNLSMAS